VAKTLEAQLREKHATLEKIVAKQSLETDRAADKVTPGLAGRKRSRREAGKPAVTAKT